MIVACSAAVFGSLYVCGLDKLGLLLTVSPTATTAKKPINKVEFGVPSGDSSFWGAEARRHMVRSLMNGSIVMEGNIPFLQAYVTWS